jgi:hypothetical protein
MAQILLERERLRTRVDVSKRQMILSLSGTMLQCGMSHYPLNVCFSFFTRSPLPKLVPDELSPPRRNRCRYDRLRRTVWPIPIAIRQRATMVQRTPHRPVGPTAGLYPNKAYASQNAVIITSQKQMILAPIRIGHESRNRGMVISGINAFS